MAVFLCGVFCMCCVYLLVHAHVCPCRFWGQRLMLDVFPRLFVIFGDWNSQIHSARRAGQQASGIWPVFPYSALELNAYVTKASLLCGSWESALILTDHVDWTILPTTKLFLLAGEGNWRKVCEKRHWGPSLGQCILCSYMLSKMSLRRGLL